MSVMRLPHPLLLVIGLAGCAYVQKGDENQVEIGHSATMSSFASVKAKADTHCGEFHKHAVLQAATSSDTTVFRCESGDAVDTAAKPASAADAAASATTGPRPVIVVPAPAQGAAPAAPPPGYAYVYPPGAYPPGAYPPGAYPQAYMVPPGYMAVPPGYVPVPPTSAGKPAVQQPPVSRVQRRQAAAPAQPTVPPVPQQSAPPPAPPRPVAVTPAVPGEAPPLQPGTALSVP